MSTSRFAHLPQPYPPMETFDKQCIELPGTKRPGQTAHYRGAGLPFKTLDSPDTFKHLLEVYDEGFRRAKGGRFLGHRPVLSTQPLKYADYHVWESWSEVDARRRAVGSALHKLFETGVLGGGDLPTVGIWSINCPNWQVVDLALQAYAKVGVSLYNTLGKDSAGLWPTCINHAELTVVFAAPMHIPALLKLAPRCPRLKMVVAMEALDHETKPVLAAWGTTVGVQVKDIAELEEFGRANLRDVITPTSKQIVTICYTSGTTGQPKGAVIDHGSMSQAVYSLMYQCGVSSEECYRQMSFLPLAHIYERVMELVGVGLGGEIGFPTGDPTRLLDDLRVLQPHMFSAVPRILNRLYQSAMSAGTAPGVKGSLFRKAVATKVHNMRTHGQFHHALYDRLVFKKLHNVLGGQLKMIVCGSAPISTDVMDFLKIGLGCIVAEGEPYGMTENCGCFIRVFPHDPTSSGTVGSPLPTSELKLVDVPELGYSVEDKPYPRGEICMRGGQRFTCYYKDPQKTAETIDEEGWLHTGDIGIFDEKFRLKIIDRKKNIMKLAQGEYVALENVEKAYSSSSLVSQVFVHGDALQAYIVGVIVPDPVQFAALVARVRGCAVAPTDFKTLVEAARDPQVNAEVLAVLTQVATSCGLQGFEQLRRIHLTLEALTTENGCLTPTLKIRRKEAYEHFKAPIDALYALGEPSKL
ncbi:acetyl-CoA synthetase-like protein [Lenzites betulinus]|nr:acetyl-CoA synthetase-like protein [Lenzites betulinus]